METALTIISLFLSLAAILITFFIYRQTKRSTIQPVVVFRNIEKNEDDPSSWCIENVGNGPALNVLVAGGSNVSHWNEDDITMIPVISCNISRRLWLKMYGALLATYSDIHGHTYTSVCYGNKHSIKRGNLYPDLKPKVYGYQIPENKS